MDDIDPVFGELRTWFAFPAPRVSVYGRLFCILRQALRANPTHYRDIVTPYLAGSMRSRATTWVAWSIEELEEFERLLPLRGQRVALDLRLLASDVMQYLASSPLLTHVTELVIPAVAASRELAVGPAGVEAFLSSPFLGQLERLELRCRLDPRRLKALLDHTNLSDLRHLDLSSTGLSPEDIVMVMRSRQMTHLTSLVISDNALGDHGVAEFAKLPESARLVSLGLARNGITEMGTESPRWEWSSSRRRLISRGSSPSISATTTWGHWERKGLATRRPLAT